MTITPSLTYLSQKKQKYPKKLNSTLQRGYVIWINMRFAILSTIETCLLRNSDLKTLSLSLLANRLFT